MDNSNTSSPLFSYIQFSSAIIPLMSHFSIDFEQVSLTFPHKTCFQDFTTTLRPHQKIGLIGRNGNGKSSLLKIITGNIEPTSSSIKFSPPSLQIGYLPQIPVSLTANLSGGEMLYQHILDQIDQNPDLLLLDEPTNHLDYFHKNQLIDFLNTLPQTLIIVSHDTQLLNEVVDEIWHLENEKITIFHGSYQNYLQKINQEKTSFTKKLHQLKNQQVQNQAHYQQEQKRFAHSQTQGRKDILNNRRPLIAAKGLKSTAQNTHAKKQTHLTTQINSIQTKIDQLYTPPLLKPRFLFKTHSASTQNLISITHGEVAYRSSPDSTQTILTNLNFSLGSIEKVNLQGNNGSGKTTFLKALLREDSNLLLTGQWHTPDRSTIGYLDQHYQTLPPNKSVLDIINAVVPQLSSSEIRTFLADFLFYTNEQVYTLAKNLSGGEKVRLILALICAQPPQLLILDELTNNLDLETKNYLLQVLNLYQGALLIVSHDHDFLSQLKINHSYSFAKKSLHRLQ